MEEKKAPVYLFCVFSCLGFLVVHLVLLTHPVHYHHLELSSAKWDPSPVLLTLQTAKHDSPPGRGNSVSLMRRQRLLLLLAGPLRLRGEPPSRGAAEGGGDAGRLCKVWEEDEASGRPGGVRGLAGLSRGSGERGLGAAPRPGPACAEDECAAAASSHSFFFAAAA